MSTTLVVKTGSSGKRSAKRPKQVLKLKAGSSVSKGSLGKRHMKTEPKELKVEVDITAFM